MEFATQFCRNSQKLLGQEGQGKCDNSSEKRLGAIWEEDDSQNSTEVLTHSS